MRFAGRAFLCCGCGWPYHRGADLRRAGCLGPRLGGARVVAASGGSGEDCRFFGVYASDGRFVVDAHWVDATGASAGVACKSGSLTSALFVSPTGGAFGSSSVIDVSGVVAQHVVIEPTGAQPPAGKTQPGIDEPTGGNPAGDTKPGSEEKPGDETKPSENPPPTPDSSPKSDAKPAPASIKTPATKTTKKTKPATTQAAALSKTGHGDWAVACLALVFLGILLVTIKVRALRGGLICQCSFCRFFPTFF